MKVVTNSTADKSHICIDLRFTLCGRDYKSEGKYSIPFEADITQVNCSSCIKKYDEVKDNAGFRALIAEVSDNPFI
jgi:hypothetical protein